MESSVALRPSVRSAFSHLIDYAGLFPPAKLALAQANGEYLEAQSGPHGWMLGRFIIPLPILATAAHAAADSFSVILDAGTESDAWLDALRSLAGEVASLKQRGVPVDVLELPLPPGAAREAGDALGRVRDALQSAGVELPTFVEFVGASRARADVEAAMAACARAGVSAKLRCGGITADAFPSVNDVVEFIAAASAARVAFKATAGLHHPVRHLDPATGFTMHGFLNVLTAAALAPRSDRTTLRQIVAEEDADAFRFESAALCWRGARVEARELEAIRRTAFVSYGSCSFSEPVEDLTALGILAR